MFEHRMSLSRLILILTMIAPVQALGAYVCMRLDLPGATQTQVWAVNDSRQVAAGSDVGGAVFSEGVWTPIPELPADLRLPADSVPAPLGLNDAGVVVGPAGLVDESMSLGFILDGGAYYLFTYHDELYTNTEPRAVNDAGLVSGWSHGGPAPLAWVYNPGPAGAYPAGFTDIVPVFDGNPSLQTIPGALNNSGLLVGSAIFEPDRLGFVYDPLWQEHGAADAFTYFWTPSRWTAARGINDNGVIAGATVSDDYSAFVAFVGTYGAGGFVVDEYVTCPELGYLWTFGQSINDDGVMAGQAYDASFNYHGFVAVPAVLPVATVDGAFVFDTAVTAGAPVFLDPEVAVGYRYATGVGNPAFTSVRLPTGIGDGSYLLLAGTRAFVLRAGQAFSFADNGFPGGVTSFRVMGIETGAALDPSSPRAFVTEVTYAADGRFTGTMEPLGVGDEIDDLLGAVMDVGPGKSLQAKVLVAQSALYTGRTDALCDVLGAFRSEVTDQSGHKLTVSTAFALGAEAAAIMDAAGCPAP